MDSKEFFGAYLFVAYGAGMDWRVNEKQHPRLRKAFMDCNIEKVSKMESLAPVFAVNRNDQKAKSVVKGAKMIFEEGFENFKKRISEQGPEALSRLPGLGPITKDHLARNIGLASVSKNDIWIQRLVSLFEAETHTELADYLANRFKETPGTVDVVLWRFCRDGAWNTLGFSSLESFVSSL
jgi:3-methyladenine DNA glycosylase Tag